MHPVPGAHQGHFTAATASMESLEWLPSGVASRSAPFLLMAPGAHGSALPQTSPNSEYSASVADIELPSTVALRASKALAGRFVDLSVSDDQSTYVVGVLNLHEEERAALTASVQGQAPIHLVNRDVALATLSAALRTVNDVLNAAGINTGTGMDAQRGQINVFLAKGQSAAATANILGSAGSGFTQSVSGDAITLTPSSPSAAGIRIVSTVIQELESSSEAPYRAGSSS